MNALPLWVNLSFLTIFILHWTFVGYALLQLARTPDDLLSRQQRRLWVILILIGPLIGSILFLRFRSTTASEVADHPLYSGPDEETLDHLYGSRDR